MPDLARRITQLDEKRLKLFTALRQRQMNTIERPVIAPLQTSGDKTPLFLMHPGSGNIQCYGTLAAQLGADQPLYALQSPEQLPEQLMDRPESEPADDLTVERMAASYLEAIRRTQPKGPYLLAGWSMGGVIAYEMSRQLRLMGERAPFVGLIDSEPTPDAAIKAGLDRISLLTCFGRDLGVSSQQLNAAHQTLRAKGGGGSLEEIFAFAKEADLLPRYLDVPETSRLFSRFERNVRALYRYTIQPNPGSISLFIARGQARDATNDLGELWGRNVKGELEIFDVPGDHYTVMIPPQVSALAEQLQRRLHRAHERISQNL